MDAQPAAPAIRRPTRRAGSPGRRTTLVVMAVTTGLIVAAAYLANRPGDSIGLTQVNLTGTPQGPAPLVGQAAPTFSAKLVDGTSISLDDLRAKVVWLTFGASWCQPCRSENPDILAAYEAFKDRGVVVVQVFMQEDQVAVRDYAARVGLTYLQIPDPAARLSTEYRILGIPTHFFIGRDGVLREMKVGTMTRPDMTQVLSGLAG